MPVRVGVQVQPQHADFDGMPRKGIATVSKAGYLYILDRTSGAPLTPVLDTPVPQDRIGRPIVARMRAPTRSALLTGPFSVSGSQPKASTRTSP